MSDSQFLGVYVLQQSSFARFGSNFNDLNHQYKCMGFFSDWQACSQAEARKPGLQHHMDKDTRNPDFS